MIASPVAASPQTTSPRVRTSSRRGAAAIILIVLGLGCGGFCRVIAGTQQDSYSAGAVPPASVRITAGQQYQLSVHGGVRALAARGLDPRTISCEYTGDGAVRQQLSTVAEATDTKAVNTIETFTAPYTGTISVDCLGWGAVFVDDADDAPSDVAGWLLVLCVLALTVGVGLGVAALRAGLAAQDSIPLAEDAEIERLVDLVHRRSTDGDDTDDFDSDGDGSDRPTPDGRGR